MRSIFFVITLSLAVLNTVRAEQIVSLPIGATPIKVAIPDGYVRTSIALPPMFDLTAAALPPATRLVESFVSEVDVKQLLLGKPAGQAPNYQVHVMRAAEGIDFSEADWAALRAETIRAMGAMDANAIIQSDASGRNQRIDEVSNGEVQLTIGEVSKPALYGNDPKSVRFTMLVPMQTKDMAGNEQVSVECAGAMVLVSSKIVMLYVYRLHAKNNRVADLHALLDSYVTRTLALQ